MPRSLHRKLAERARQARMDLNEFVVAEKGRDEILKIDQALERQQQARVAKVRAERNQEAAARTLERVERPQGKGPT
jgi:methylmalonyl-CoA mutase N-terminal domain/subunit